MARRRTFKLRPQEYLQMASGLAIPLLLAGHFSGTHMAVEWYGLNDTYFYVIWNSWVTNPLTTGLMIAGLIVVWIHGVFGLHFWLRLKPWYAGSYNYLFAAAVLIPALSLTGFATAGKEVALMAENR